MRVERSVSNSADVCTYYGTRNAFRQWVLPLLVWLSMGNSEARHGTEGLIFAVAFRMRGQLSTCWAASFVVALTAGSGVALQLMLASQWSALLARGTAAFHLMEVGGEGHCRAGMSSCQDARRENVPASGRGRSGSLAPRRADGRWCPRSKAVDGRRKCRDRGRGLPRPAPWPP